MKKHLLRRAYVKKEIDIFIFRAKKYGCIQNIEDESLKLKRGICGLTDEK